jgi:hypothetical protein
MKNRRCRFLVVSRPLPFSSSIGEPFRATDVPSPFHQRLNSEILRFVVEINHVMFYFFKGPFINDVTG